MKALKLFFVFICIFTFSIMFLNCSSSSGSKNYRMIKQTNDTNGDGIVDSYFIYKYDSADNRTKGNFNVYFVKKIFDFIKKLNFL